MVFLKEKLRKQLKEQNAKTHKIEMQKHTKYESKSKVKQSPQT